MDKKIIIGFIVLILVVGFVSFYVGTKYSTDEKGPRGDGNFQMGDRPNQMRNGDRKSINGNSIQEETSDVVTPTVSE